MADDEQLFAALGKKRRVRKIYRGAPQGTPSLISSYPAFHEPAGGNPLKDIYKALGEPFSEGLQFREQGSIGPVSHDMGSFLDQLKELGGPFDPRNPENIPGLLSILWGGKLTPAQEAFLRQLNNVKPAAGYRVRNAEGKIIQERRGEPTKMLNYLVGLAGHTVEPTSGYRIAKAEAPINFLPGAVREDPALSTMADLLGYAGSQGPINQLRASILQGRPAADADSLLGRMIDQPTGPPYKPQPPPSIDIVQALLRAARQNLS